MKTVAIVGSEPRTKDLAPYHDLSIDIWAFNQSVKLMPRVTAAFQMHDPAIYRDPKNKFDYGHWEWLQQRHDYPIYMIAADQDVPNSLYYPLKEILEKYPEVEKRMFTQTGCYALALALYLGYEKAMIYGIENEHFSEYSSEREGFIYWTGFLQGKGVIVEKISGANMFDNPLYGREKLWLQDPDFYTRHLVDLEIELRKRTREFKKLEKSKFEEWNEALYFLGVAEGRRTQCNIYLDMVKTQIQASGRAVIVPSELILDRKQVINLIQEGRNLMEQSRGANNIQQYADNGLATAQYIGQLKEIEFMQEEAAKWQLREDDKWL